MDVDIHANSSHLIEEPTTPMDKEKQYELLADLEQKTTQLRHTTFTALLSISFLLPGLAFQGSTEKVEFIGRQLPLSGIAFLLGFCFYLFAVIHYLWYHRYSHRYRGALKELGKQLGISVYSHRVRPQLWRMKFHFDWFLYLLGILYFSVTAAYVGLAVVLTTLTIGIVMYAALSIWSIFWREEPLE